MKDYYWILAILFTMIIAAILIYNMIDKHEGYEKEMSIEKTYIHQGDEL